MINKKLKGEGEKRYYASELSDIYQDLITDIDEIIYKSTFSIFRDEKDNLIGNFRVYKKEGVVFSAKIIIPGIFDIKKKVFLNEWEPNKAKVIINNLDINEIDYSSENYKLELYKLIIFKFYETIDKK